MKINIKRILSSVLLSSLLFSTACSNVPAEDLPVLMSFRNTDSSAVVAMIDEITEASFETESAIEAAFIAYYELEGDSKNQVTNYERLLTLRDEIADLYEDTTKRGVRIDRSKILIGTYCVNYYDDAHVKEVADCGIDFIAAANYNGDFLDTLAKYGIGAFVSARDVVDHEAIWGIELIDEPHSSLFPGIGQSTQELLDKYPNYQVYINLFPNYATADNLGNANEYKKADYVGHIQQYIEYVNTDYVSYDHYMYNPYHGGWSDYIENLRIVADACRPINKDYWVVIEANHPMPDSIVSLDQLKFQANTAIAFGYTVVNWACWNPGWWYNNICDAAGNKTEQYDKVKQVNEEINILSPVYMKYKNIDVNLIGAESADCTAFYRYDDNVIDQNVFVDVSMPKGTVQTVLCGYFEKRIGEGSAMMFVNVTDSMCEDKNAGLVYFKVSKADAVVTEHTASGSFILEPDANGYYSITVENAEYSFVTVE